MPVDTAPAPYSLPTFVPPASTKEARERIAELDSAITSINDQIAYREMSGTQDPDWFKRSSTSRRFKMLERQRLENWIDEYVMASEMGDFIEKYIVAVVRQDYSDEDWADVVAEASEAMKSGARIKEGN